MTDYSDLEMMLDMQQVLQGRYADGDPTTMFDDRQRINFIGEQWGNMVHELCEAHDEVTWKSWHQGELRINAEMAAKELIDAWHFFMNWLLTLRPLLGFENNTQLAEWFVGHYIKKNEENHLRISSGSYDGHSHQLRGDNDVR
jgi:dUTPase